MAKRQSKNAVNVAVVPLPPVEIIDVHDPAGQIEIEPTNARFSLEPVDLSGIGADGKPTKWHWRTPVRTSDLIHVHRAEDGKLYATDGNRRVKTLQNLKATNPGEYAKMLAEYEARTGKPFQVAVYSRPLSKSEILWALRDVDAEQKGWSAAERLSHFRRLRAEGASFVEAAGFFGKTRYPEAERLERLPDEVSDLYIETHRDAEMSEKPEDRRYSSTMTGAQIAELTKLADEYQKANPGAIGTGPEYARKLAEIREELTAPAGEKPWKAPTLPASHVDAFNPAIARLVARGELLAARALAVATNRELTGDETITRTIREGEIEKFIADVSAM